MRPRAVRAGVRDDRMPSILHGFDELGSALRSISARVAVAEVPVPKIMRRDLDPSPNYFGNALAESDQLSSTGPIVGIRDDRLACRWRMGCAIARRHRLGFANHTCRSRR